MRAVLRLGVEIINDVTALRDPDAVAAVRDSAARVILMHSTAASARAERLEVNPARDRQPHRGVLRSRIVELEAAGIARAAPDPRPGHGLLPRPRSGGEPGCAPGPGPLTALGLPLCVSTSRKSFIGGVLGTRAARGRSSSAAPGHWRPNCGPRSTACSTSGRTTCVPCATHLRCGRRLRVEVALAPRGQRRRQWAAGATAVSAVPLLLP